MTLQIGPQQPETLGHALFSGIGGAFQQQAQALGQQQQEQQQREAKGRQLYQVLNSQQYKDLPVDDKMTFMSAIFPEAGKAQLEQQKLVQQQGQKQQELSQKERHHQEQLQSKLDVAEIKSKNQLTGVAKKVQDKTTDVIFNAIESTEKLRGSRQNIQTLRELSSQLKGPGGYLKAAIGTQEATQLKALGMTAVEPVFGIFSQGGSRLSDFKVKEILRTHAVNPWDRTSVIEGKLNALEILVTNAEAYQEKIIALYEEYGDDIPLDKLLKLGREGDQIIDKAINKTLKAPEAKKGNGVTLDKNNPEHRKIISQIIKEANNDVQEAERIATQRGYKF